MSTVLIFLLFGLLDGRQWWKNHRQLKEMHYNKKKKKNMHTRKELEAL